MANIEDTLKIGIQFHEAGRYDDARQCYGKILRSDSKHADANHLLGVLEYQRGKADLAIAHITKALAKRPSSPLYLNSLGAAYRELGRLADARGAFERAIQIQPGYAEPYNNLGTVLAAIGEFAAAEACYQKALAVKPGFLDVFINMGGLFHSLHRYDEAEAALRSVLKLAPHNPLAWNNLGNVYKSRERLAEAADCYMAALRADANCAACWGNLALTLQSQGDWNGAVAAFDKSFELRAAPGLLVKRALALPVIIDTPEQIHEVRQRLDTEVERILNSNLRVDDVFRNAGVTVFHLAYHGIDDRDRYRRVAQMYSHICPSLNYVAPHCVAPRVPRGSRGRGRVAFISQFFHNHSVSKHFAGVVSHLPRERFEVVLLRFPGSGDDAARAIAESADMVVTLPPDLDRARDQIAALELDVLYYTDIGMEPLTYFLSFARLAHLQCVASGHPVTTGVPAIDCFVSCDAVETPGGDAHYTERLVRMKSLPNYFARPQLFGPTPTRAEFGMSEDWHVYVCAQNLCKLHPEFDLILGEILRKDPQGRVILFHGSSFVWSERLADRFRRTIPDVAERVGFLDHLPNDRFLHLLTLCDAVLDSTHFNGGTTTAQGLGVGAPIVTLPGEFMRARQCYASYHQMQMFDCVARDAADYVRIAVRLGTDPVYRASIREKILANNSVLYDNPSFAIELEGFFAHALEQQLQRAA
ncbi:MAG TPA: tetratricopeptide repeat protein [Planctomycetaceae bacterium]|jgi:predicted O-linked N-acetylglucosamine transferase (SPINDLY family)